MTLLPLSFTIKENYEFILYFCGTNSKLIQIHEFLCKLVGKTKLSHSKKLPFCSHPSLHSLHLVGRKGNVDEGTVQATSNSFIWSQFLFRFSLYFCMNDIGKVKIKHHHFGSYWSLALWRCQSLWDTYEKDESIFSSLFQLFSGPMIGPIVFYASISPAQ